MKAIFFLLFSLFYSNYCRFLAAQSEQEYTLLCTEQKPTCLIYHEKYLECGKQIFKLWFLLDLIQSISVKDIEHSYLHTDVLINITAIYENLFDFYAHFEDIHEKDLLILEYFLQKILSHQVIQSIDCLKNTFLSCQELLDQIKE